MVIEFSEPYGCVVQKSEKTGLYLGVVEFSEPSVYVVQKSEKTGLYLRVVDSSERPISYLLHRDVPSGRLGSRRLHRMFLVPHHRRL